MIGKAKSNISLAKTIDYQLKQASELFYTNNLAGENIDDYRMQMEDLEKCYTGYGKQLLIHTILSPSIEDGQKLDKGTWTRMADMYLEELRLKENHQAMGFIHRDKEHYHCHIVVSKINMDNYKLFKDSFIGKRTQHIADKIAKEFGLVRAMDIKRENLKKSLAKKETLPSELQLTSLIDEETPKGIRQKFKQQFKQINERKFQNTEAYFQALQDKGFKVIRHFDDSHNIRGYSVEKDGTMLNATTIGKEFSLRKLGLMNGPAVNEKINQENKTGQKQEAIQPLNNEKLKQSLYQFFEEQGIVKNTIDKSNIEFIRQGKYYYAAMGNNSGGYVAVNPFTNENIGTKDITTIGSYKNVDVMICEDVFDYLRQLQNDRSQSQNNYIILNGIYHAEKLKEELKQLQPKQILFNEPKQQTENKKQSINGEQHQPSTNLLKNFIKILFSDEHEIPPAQDLYQERKKKKRLRPNW